MDYGTDGGMNKELTNRLMDGQTNGLTEKGKTDRWTDRLTD